MYIQSKQVFKETKQNDLNKLKFSTVEVDIKQRI